MKKTGNNFIMKGGTLLTGSTLVFNKDEVNLCYSVPIVALGDRNNFIKELQIFIAITLDTNRQLELIK